MPTSLAAPKRGTRKSLKDNSTNRWNQKLLSLNIQNNFLNITELEAENHFWRRIMDGLSSGQLSFLLRAGSASLPKPMNLQRYRIQVSSHCKLCQRPQSTTGQVVSTCPETLKQGRYTWRQDSILLSHLHMYVNVLAILSSPGGPQSSMSIHSPSFQQ